MTILTGSLRLADFDIPPGASVAAAVADGALSIARLTLTDFRCYAHQRLETDGRPVVLTGPNGAGKTNLLEAVSFMVPGRGLRRARLDEVARIGSAGTWAVAARLRTPAGPVEIGTGRQMEAGRERRVVRIDGEPAKSQALLAEHLAAVWLTPQMDRLFQEGASARRRFLDRLVFAFDPAHAGRVTAYEHALRERTRLLAEGGADPAWLAALEDGLASRGIAIAAARLDLVGRLGTWCARSHGPFPGAMLRLEGLVESWLETMPAVDAEDRLRAALAASRNLDAGGTATVGAHRSDLGVHHLAKGMAAAQCSTGEQKALLIAIVLAHARLLAEERGAAPLLLLDEVAAHLDGERREALFDTLQGLGVQAWVTGTDAALFHPWRGKAQFIRVADAVATLLD